MFQCIVTTAACNSKYDEIGFMVYGQFMVSTNLIYCLRWVHYEPTHITGRLPAWQSHPNVASVRATVCGAPQLQVGV